MSINNQRKFGKLICRGKENFSGKIRITKGIYNPGHNSLRLLDAL